MNYSNTVTDSNRSENKMESYRMCLLIFQLVRGKSVHFWESRSVLAAHQYNKLLMFQTFQTSWTL